jgi:phytoene dehydrogenase-like protein
MQFAWDAAWLDDSVFKCIDVCDAATWMLPLDCRPSAAFGLVLAGMAHVVGWVLPRGGAQSLSNALAAHLLSLGGDQSHSPRGRFGPR